MPHSRQDMWLHLSSALLWFEITFCFLVSSAMCIRITEFNVIPNEVREGDEVTLVCNYDTEGGQLYSLKWYREESEFFRLEPNSNHSRLLFRVKGIKVDRLYSNGTVVVIKQVNALTSGMFTCEVSAEKTFQTATREKLLIVKPASELARTSYGCRLPLPTYSLLFILFITNWFV